MRRLGILCSIVLIALLTTPVSAQGSWTSLANTPNPIGQHGVWGYGGDLAYTGGDYIYAIRGKDTQEFWRYSISSNSWTSLADTPVTNRGHITWAGGDFIFLAQGWGTGGPAFWEYSISSNIWTEMAAPPEQGDSYGFAWGGGDYVYLLRGENYPEFWRYSISGNSWTALADFPPYHAMGCSLVWTGGNYLYAFPENGKQEFWRYSISANSWQRMADAPDYPSTGRCLAWNGVDKIYAALGFGGAGLWAYIISQGVWQYLTDSPSPIEDGGAIVFVGGSEHIYATQGGGTTNFMRFDVPAPTPAAVGGVYVPVNKLTILAPYLGLVGLVGAVVVALATTRRRKV